MKTLTLLRHAKSGWDDTVARDFDRPLNPKGKRAAEAIGRYMRDQELTFDHVVASPALRVVETIASVERGLGHPLAATFDRRCYLASAATLADVVRESAGDASRVLLIGHNPGLEDVVLTMTPDAPGPLRDAVEEKYPTATLAELTFAIDDWDAIAAGGATLTRFTRPRDLDADLGPDAD